MLKIINITAAYHHGHPILSDVSLELGSGERLAILGRNGAGKTTFANSIFGLTPLV
ncbi:MAG: ABC transporter ATP-binding protein, partial [Bacteroidetes bacterium]